MVFLDLTIFFIEETRISFTKIYHFEFYQSEIFKKKLLHNNDTNFKD